MEMKLDDLYYDAISIFEVEDNYSNRTIVAVLKDANYETEDKYIWGVMFVNDDPDPEADLPNFFVKGRGLDQCAAIEQSRKYFTDNCQ